MAHHMAGKFTIHDLRPYPVRVANPLSYGSPVDGLFNHASALTAAEELAEKGFRPRVDFSIVSWIEDRLGRVLVGSSATIHDRAETLWQEWKAKQPKPKVVVELYAGANYGKTRFGWLIVISHYSQYETRIALKREEATEFSGVTPAHLAAWHKDLGSPEHVSLVPREVTP